MPLRDCRRLYTAMKNSGQMTIGKTHSSLYYKKTVGIQYTRSQYV